MTNSFIIIGSLGLTLRTASTTCRAVCRTSEAAVGALRDLLQADLQREKAGAEGAVAR